MLTWLSDPPPDHVFEISEFALAGVSPRLPDRQNRERFTDRALTASPSLPNLIRPQLFRDALAKVAAVNGARRMATALVIPDYAVRMAILDFEDFPPREEDRISLLRFRLRKTVPFHIEEARLAYSVQDSRPGHLEILAVAIANPILHEYESIFVEAGYRVGLVIPSLVAALPFCHTAQLGAAPLSGITLLAKSTGSTLSIGLIERTHLRLVRCIDLSTEEIAPSDRPARSSFPVLQQTLAFAEDQLEQKVNRALLCGFGADTDAVGDQIEYEFGIPYAPVTSRFGAAHGENAGLLGLLEQFSA
jgi:type IV pilus assembly protein PilM